MGASQSLITKMYSEYLLASKVYQSLIGSVDEEVSDDEARIIEGMQIFVCQLFVVFVDALDEIISLFCFDLS